MGRVEERMCGWTHLTGVWDPNGSREEEAGCQQLPYSLKAVHQCQWLVTNQRDHCTVRLGNETGEEEGGREKRRGKKRGRTEKKERKEGSTSLPTSPGGSKTLNTLQKCPLTYQQLDVPGIEMVKTRNMFLHILQNAHQTTHTGTKTTKGGDKKKKIDQIVRFGF